jgi:hypothetical protein
MSRRLDRRPRLAVLAIALLLGASAAVAAAPSPRAAAPKPARAASLAAVVWKWWLGSWSSSLRPMVGREGSGIDPNGKRARAGILLGYPVPPAHEGVGIGLNGLH